MAGRVPKLTPDVTRKIVAFILAGNYREVAAVRAGIDRWRLHKWMDEGKKRKAGIYCDFRNAVLEAEQEAEARMVKIIIDAASVDAKNAQWWLERKFPERWGKDTWKIAELVKRINELEKRIVIDNASHSEQTGEANKATGGEQGKSSGLPG